MYSTVLPSTHQPPPPMIGNGRPENDQLKRWTDMTVGLIVVILNILEIILITQVKRQKRKNYEIVLLSLSVADLLFGISNATVSMIYLIDRRMKSALEITYTTYFYFVLTSMLHLVFIGVDRVVAVVKPMKHNIFMTQKRLYKILVAIWLVSTLTAVTLYITNEKTDTFKKREFIFEENNTVSFNLTTLFRESYNSTQNITTQNAIANQRPCIAENNTANSSVEQRRIKQSRNPPKRTGRPQKPPTQIRKYFDNANSTEGCRTPPQKQRPPTKRMHLKENFKATMELVLSYVIIVADLVLLLTYALIVYRMKQRIDTIQTRKQNERVSIVCILVAGVFVVFTLPYAFRKLVVGHTGYWVNILLVSNSGLNCVVYFFRGYCENRNSRKKAKYVDNSSSALTPATTQVTTPLSSRTNLFADHSLATSTSIL